VIYHTEAVCGCGHVIATIAAHATASLETAAAAQELVLRQFLPACCACPKCGAAPGTWAITTEELTEAR
jgi:hypothetical protein